MYVQRNSKKQIIGAFKWPNELTDETPIPDDDPRIAKFLSGLRGEKKPSKLEAVLIRKGIIAEEDLG